MSAPGTKSRKRRAQQPTDDEDPRRPNGRKVGKDSSSNSTSSKKRKARQDDDPDDLNDHTGKRFRYLKPRTRYIPQDVITSKWSALLVPAQQQVCEILRAAKRPVILSQRDERRRAEAEVALGMVIRRLEKQLPRMPFPPKTNDAHFDLEKLIERNRVLENQLTPALHSVELLKAETEREEQALDRDKAVLATLESNARAEERLQQKQAKKIHPLLQSTVTSPTILDDAESIGLVSSKVFDRSLLEGPDPELDPLLQQLQSHLESMRANSMQVKGVEDALERSHMALDEVMYKHLSLQQYERLMAS